jgi:uncharacterized membrane protein YdbT with pleckstrin-like domain
MDPHPHATTITVRQTPILLILKLTIVSVMFDCAFLAVAFISDSFEPFGKGVAWNLIAYDTLSYIALMVLQIGIAFFLMFLWYREFFFIDEGFLIHRKGLFLVQEKRFKLSNVKSVTQSQTFFGKLFNYGTILLNPQNQNEKFQLPGIPEPELFIHFLEDHQAQKPLSQNP